MVNTHYFSFIEQIKKNRSAKILHYWQFLELLGDEINLQITAEFYQNYPFERNYHTLKEQLKMFVDKQIMPSSAFETALEDYFRFRVENSVF